MKTTLQQYDLRVYKKSGAGFTSGAHSALKKVTAVAVTSGSKASWSLRQQGGFTLIELLLYVSITAIMLVILGGMGVGALESRNKSAALQEVHYNTQFIFEKITTAVRQAESVSEPVMGATSTTLSLVMENPDNNPTVFSVSDGILWMTVGDEAPAAISTADVEIVGTVFTGTAYAGTPHSVRVSVEGRPTNQPDETTPRSYTARTTIHTNHTP